MERRDGSATLTLKIDGVEHVFGLDLKFTAEAPGKQIREGLRRLADSAYWSLQYEYANGYRGLGLKELERWLKKTPPEVIARAMDEYDKGAVAA